MRRAHALWTLVKTLSNDWSNGDIHCIKNDFKILFVWLKIVFKTFFKRLKKYFENAMPIFAVLGALDVFYFAMYFGTKWQSIKLSL